MIANREFIHQLGLKPGNDYSITDISEKTTYIPGAEKKIHERHSYRKDKAVYLDPIMKGATV